MLAGFYLLAASAAVLVLAQAPARGQVIPGCTTISFQIPSWFVGDLLFIGARGHVSNVSFNVLNRAANYTADLACALGQSGWNECDVQGTNTSGLQASVYINGPLASVSLNQTWTCNDRNGTDPFPFTAAGNGSVCKAVNSPFLVKAALLTPVAITPVYADGPTGHNTPGCAAAATSPSWSLSDIHYVNQTGDGIHSTNQESFNVIVYNAAIGYTASCMPGVGNAMVCAGDEFGSIGRDRYSLSTDATFDPQTFRFSINQTWYCDDADPGKPVAIKASASQVLPLKCSSAAIEGVPNGEKKTCVTDDTTLKGALVSQQSLAPYSIEDPTIMPDGCTIESVLGPQWTFSSFEVDTPDSGSSGPPSVSFNVILQTQNRGFQFPLSIYQGAPIANSSAWYECDLGGGGNTGQPLWPIACSFQYTPATQALVLKADWSCSEFDPVHPIIFSGITTTTIKSPMSCSTAEGISQCIATDLSYSWTADIHNVTWYTGTR
ncbi:hypothetical protein B0T26DRAFT_636167 [Lasiosphaeria miniovina]|uniref:Ig-like domain-containing protein n=1 Tax=Lasiosphaeria miniovina TaxID=1954250 RepID=A0AA40E3M8_9PEZI|nr:uncharacterized protein B0T26DRAFT_636167 [Lasiosphaeria miniovina]KAK0726844.1 hypothetical protein B0T26DRAFT_636167 [Lasiosphaeria miniovina]